MDRTDTGKTDRDSGSTAPDMMDRRTAILEAHRKREVQLAEQIVRLETDLADLRSSVAEAAGQLRRLNSRYTVVRSLDGQINNAERLYELLARDARQIGQELSLSLPVTPPRQPFAPLP